MMNSKTIHATCVTYGQRGLLIVGKSGSGKSGLALQLMAFGADLVADDRVTLFEDAGVITARCPAPIKNLIEARGIGLLASVSNDSTVVNYVVDLDQIEPDRLPEHRKITILGVEIDLIFGKDTPNLPATLHQLMKIGRVS